MEPTIISGSETLHPNNKQNDTPQITYSEEAKTYINFRRQRLIAARDARDASHPEFDDMTFLKWYEIQKKADDQYVAPRKNAQDTSINTGTVRDKDNALLEYAMKFDFEPVAQVYSEDDEMMAELADTAEDMVRKSKKLEAYRDKAKLIYRSMIAFGTALVEDTWVERWTIQKTLKQGYKAGIGSNMAEWEEKLVKQYDGCQAKLWDLRKCYFGDIRKFFMNGPQGQPFFFTVEYESYDVVKTIFGNWDRWKYVPTTVTPTAEVSAPGVFTSWWTLRPISMNYVEIVRYYDPIMNEFAITLNGVDMLEIMERKITQNGIEKTLVSGFPLTEVSPSGAINFAKYDLEPMHDFAYSKSQPAKMRVWSDVENMYIKLIIGMMKQKAKPTLGNKSGKLFGEEVTDPATVINDIREGDLFPVLPNFQGATTADFSFYELIKKELDKNSVERSFQGMDNQPQNETATADMNDMKAASLKVAAMLDGIISGENQLNWLRTYSIIRNWTKPIDVEIDTVRKTIQNKYRSVSIETSVDGGQKAMKKVIFTKDTTMSSQDVHQEEMDAKKNGKGEVRNVYLHPEQLAAIKLNWFYTCVPIPTDSDPLSYMMFAKQVNDAAGIFGPDSLNVKKLKYKFASKTGEDFDNWFIDEQELEQKRQQAAAIAGGGDGSEVPSQGPGHSTKSMLANRTGAPVPTIGKVMKNAQPQVSMK